MLLPKFHDKQEDGQAVPHHPCHTGGKTFPGYLHSATNQKCEETPYFFFFRSVRVP